MSEKRKSQSPSLIQVKNQSKTVGNKQTLDEITPTEQGERSVDIHCHVRLAHSSIYTICDNASKK
jgi:hypothetical protein